RPGEFACRGPAHQGGPREHAVRDRTSRSFPRPGRDGIRRRASRGGAGARARDQSLSKALRVALFAARDRSPKETWTVRPAQPLAARAAVRVGRVVPAARRSRNGGREPPRGTGAAPRPPATEGGPFTSLVEPHRPQRMAKVAAEPAGQWKEGSARVRKRLAGASAMKERAMSTERPRVLLTGGAGFIGSHLAEALLARGMRLTIVDSLDE